MSAIDEQVKELRELADCYYGEIRNHVGTITRAADTIESLYAKLQTDNGEYETILQEIREKLFCVEAGEYYSDSVVSYDDVEEIIRSHMKGENDGKNKN